MDVADQDDAQSKKVFRARKTMKISDRQQLESIHSSHTSSTLSSSTDTPSSPTPPPAVVNGKYPEEEQTGRESHTDKITEETRPSPPVSRTPSPLTLSLSLSPSPPSQPPQLLSASNTCLSPANSPKSEAKENDSEQRDDGGETERSSLAGGLKTEDENKMEGTEVKEKEDSAEPQATDKENENPKPDSDDSSPLHSPQDPAITPDSPLASERKDEERNTETQERTESEEAVAMDTNPAAVAIKVLEVNESIPADDVVSPSSPSLSLSHAPESDLEVKEGFLVLSEEDENQRENDEEKEKEEVKAIKGEDMDVDIKEEEKDKKDVIDPAPPSPSSSPAPTPAAPSGDPAEAATGHSILSGKKRVLCADSETEGEEREEERVVRDGKRLKVEGGAEELEAQLELKIRANGNSRIKLEKVVQQLVEEQLRVLQLSVFDRSLQELRERVEKIDCATKHQQTLNTLQAKIARLAKKFGAANQAKENIRKPEEGLKPGRVSDMVVTSTKPKQRTVANGVRSTLYKAVQGELPDPDVLKVAEAYKDFSAAIAPLITTMGLSTDLPLVDSAFGKVQKGSPISYQHPAPVSRIILLHPDAPPPPPLPLDGYRLEPTRCQFVCSLQQQLHLQSLETNLEKARKVEAATREQSVSADWHQVKRNRITSSHFREICHVRGQSSAEELAEQIRKGGGQRQKKESGLEVESVAIQEYCRVKNNSYWPCGFVIHPDAPWLGSSPAGVVFDPTENPPFGLLEIKFPNAYSYVNCKYLKFLNDTVELKRQHSYYWQVQGQLLITGMEWCDFAVFADEDMVIQRIYKDAEISAAIREKGDYFFFHFYMAVCLNSPCPARRESEEAPAKRLHMLS